MNTDHTGKAFTGMAAQPGAQVNQEILAAQYALAPDRWDKAFDLLKSLDFNALEAGKHEVDGENLFFMVNHYVTKPAGEVPFEAHRKYADIQYVFEGEELIGVAPMEVGTETVPYSPEKDIAFYAVKESVSHRAAPDTILVYFPEDLHQPGVMTGEPKPVKKVVVKVKLIFSVL